MSGETTFTMEVQEEMSDALEDGTPTRVSNHGGLNTPHRKISECVSLHGSILEYDAIEYRIKYPFFLLFTFPFSFTTSIFR